MKLFAVLTVVATTLTTCGNQDDHVENSKIGKFFVGDFLYFCRFKSIIDES